MSEQLIDTGFADLVAPASVITELVAEKGTPENTAFAPDPASVPHPNGPTVAEQLAAHYTAAGDVPAETEAERAFAQPIKLLEPQHLHTAATIVGDDPNAVVESAVAQSNREIYERIITSRNQPPAVPTPQPVAKRIHDQTRAEMAEGARISAIHAERSRTVPRPRPSPREVAAQGTSTPVFRPADFIPGQNQGDVRAQPVTS